MTALEEIFENIKRGGVYGRTCPGRRWAYFSENLYLIDNLTPGAPFIGYSSFGSSATRCNIDDLQWIIETIFKTTPAEFIKNYECRL